MKVPQIKRNSDGDRLEDERPQFDYFKTREALQRRFQSFRIPARRVHTIEDHRVEIVTVHADDSETTMVLREALISYHLEKLRAKHEAAEEKRKP